MISLLFSIEKEARVLRLFYRLKRVRKVGSSNLPAPTISLPDRPPGAAYFTLLFLTSLALSYLHA
jgi:hypothetical protein